ncbi:hypothetical protein [Endozoicomonas sp. ONNA2]|uniref:hypothetical protein n=1 Tax=Endozoicomonas sp. ONNA2 TaxID=2828741 RepID=UPI002148FA60|nr:hypothetical protein [Endozoicomonas sp. ONNA2]
MVPTSHISMFRENWGNNETDNGFASRDRNASELFWRHGSGHKTFTTEDAINNLIEHSTVNHIGCFLVSFDSGKRKVARLNPTTRLLFPHQLPHESIQDPGMIKELSSRDIILLHGFSEFRDAQAFERHLRVRSYFNEDGIYLLDKFPGCPSADQMASYGYVFSEIRTHGGKACIDMNSIWQSDLRMHFALETINKQASDDITIEDIYSDSCGAANVDEQQYLTELKAARRQPVLKLNQRDWQNNEILMPFQAWRSVVQTEDARLPELQLITPARVDVLTRCNPPDFPIPANPWSTGSAAGYNPSSANPVFRQFPLMSQVRQPVKSYPSAYPHSQVRTLHLASSGAGTFSATLKFAGSVLRHLMRR